MKRFQALLIAALAFGLASTAGAFTGTYVPGAGINGTVHDIPNGAGIPAGYLPNPADARNRICVYCHAPHNTYRLSAGNGGAAGSGPQAPTDEFDYLPLWNHDLTTQQYSMYYNGPGQPAAGPKHAQSIDLLGGATRPGGVSLLCLSCHDGSIGVNEYGNAAQPPQSDSGGGTTMTGGAYTVGQNGNLQNHHPIGFDYDAAQAVDTELRVSSSTLGWDGTSISDHLFGGKLECASCHSVHNKGNGNGAGLGGETLLWRSDANSGLCLACHDKGAVVP